MIKRDPNTKKDPNKAFKQLKHPYASPRPYQSILLIRCDSCGWKKTVSRELWQSEDDIECDSCGRFDYWSLL